MNTYANFHGSYPGRFFDSLRGFIESFAEQSHCMVLDVGPRRPEQHGMCIPDDIWHGLFVRQHKPLIAVSLSVRYPESYPGISRGALAQPVNPFAKAAVPKEPPPYDEAGWHITTRVGTGLAKEWSGNVFETEKLDAVIDYIIATLKAE